MSTRLPTPLPLLLALAACFGAAQAAPLDPVVVAGQATFTQQGNTFSITSTPGAVINWHSFSVAPGEITRFIQQSADSAVLNRVTGQDPSRILGALQSNGQVFLINPNGIVFGKDARIDVAGLTASTLDIANSDFVSGKRQFKAGATAGRVVNQGSIATPSGGQVYLIAPEVENSGVISAPDGSVVLAAGRSVQLVDSANPDVQVVLAAPQDAAINLGQVVSQGGRIGIYGALVRQQGVANADSARVGANGRIVLKASGDTLLEAGSRTSATGAGSGGTIHLLGKRVGLTGDAQVDASGRQGGGTVLVGGDYQGSNPQVPHARETLLGKDAAIRADALEAGDGGKVVLWGDATTRAFGRISARGAGAGGGGLVETSAAYLDIAGLRVDAGADSGLTGTWLLDPYDIEIVGGPSGAPLVDADSFAEGADESTTTIAAATFAALPTAANVVLQARHDVSFKAPLTRAAGTSGRMTVEAGNDIKVDAPIDTRGGALTLRANHAQYASGDGSVLVNAPINTGAATFSASGRNVVVEGAGAIQAGAIDLRAAHSFQLGSGGQLASGGYIDIVADRVGLAGAIGAAGGQRPAVSFLPYSGTRAIEIGEFDGSEGTRLHFTPEALASIDADSLNIGGSAARGGIEVVSAWNPAMRNVVLQTAGNLSIRQPLALAASGSTLLLEAAAVLVDEPATLTAHRIMVRADNMTLSGLLTATPGTGSVSLAPHRLGTAIEIGAEAVDGSGKLGLDQDELGRISAQDFTIGGLDGQYGDVTVRGYSGVAPLGATLNILAGEGDLRFHDEFDAGRRLTLQGGRISSATDALVVAPRITLDALDGIGSAGAPLATKTAYLSATNDNPRGSAPINIYNIGALDLGNVTQSGSLNNGAIDILNEGGMTLLAGQQVKAIGTGVVSLRTRSPLTIAGSVRTGSGAVNLEAGNGGVLTVAATGTVYSGGGIAATGGSIVNDGLLSTTSGTITTVGPVSGSGTMVTPSDPGPGDPGPVDPGPVDPGPVDPGPVDPGPVDPGPVDPGPVDPGPVDPGPVDPGPVDPGPVDPGPVDPGPVDPGPVDPGPVDPGPVNPGPVVPTLEQCVANPGLSGCGAVLPPKEAPVGSPLHGAVATTINLINQASAQFNGQQRPDISMLPGGPAQAGADGENGPGKRLGNGAQGAGDGTNEGGKSGKLVKTYCN